VTTGGDVRQRLGGATPGLSGTEPVIVRRSAPEATEGRRPQLALRVLAPYFGKGVRVPGAVGWPNKPVWIRLKRFKLAYTAMSPPAESPSIALAVATRRCRNATGELSPHKGLCRKRLKRTASRCIVDGSTATRYSFRGLLATARQSEIFRMVLQEFWWSLPFPTLRPGKSPRFDI
jgi:hypothetical protein